ncbi:MAG TPA: hypothetical protein VLF67_05355 [Candidatus Saccharimonas sp.]|nr:hypothetical protein [Candidatus Saccharimonas sp.]
MSSKTLVTPKEPKALVAASFEPKEELWSAVKFNTVAGISSVTLWLGLNATAIALNWGGWVFATLILGGVACMFLGALITYGFEHVAWLRLDRLKTKHQQLGNIIEVPDVILTLWGKVRDELGDRRRREELGMTAHFGFVRQLMVLLESAEGVSRTVRNEYEARIKAEIVARLQPVWVALNSAEEFAATSKVQSEQIVQDGRDAAALQVLRDTPPLH